MSPDDIAAHLARAEVWYKTLRERATLHSYVNTVKMNTEDLLALARTEWRARLKAALSVEDAASILASAEATLTTRRIESCPRWCLSQAARSWACETLDCQPCVEACLAIKPPAWKVLGAAAPKPDEPFRDIATSNDHQVVAESAWLASQQRTWTCPPTWPPRHLFVLFTLPRSASSTACSVINTLPDSYCAYELLNEKQAAWDDSQRKLLNEDPAHFLQQQYEAAFSGTRAAPCAATFELKGRTRRPQSLRVVARRCIWGFKAFDIHLTNVTFLDWLMPRLSTEFVLERRDGARSKQPSRHSDWAPY